MNSTRHPLSRIRPSGSRPIPSACRALLALLVFTLTIPVFAADGISVTDAWIRLLPGTLPAAGYFVIHNANDRPVELTEASAPDFASVAIHKNMTHEGMTGMVHVSSVTIPAHGKVEFRPGSYHLMLMQPNRQLSVGDTEQVTLQLADGSKITAQFKVRSEAALGVN